MISWNVLVRVCAYEGFRLLYIFDFLVISFLQTRPFLPLLLDLYCLNISSSNCRKVKVIILQELRIKWSLSKVQMVSHKFHVYNRNMQILEAIEETSKSLKLLQKYQIVLS